MHLSFDNLYEFVQFLTWAEAYGAAPATLQAWADEHSDQADKETVSQNNGTSDGETAPPSDRDDTGNNESGSAAPTVEPEAPVKRTRRKKVGSATVTDLEAESGSEEVESASAGPVNAQANPFAAQSETADKALAEPEQGATGLTSSEPLPEISPIEHLTACQAAIKAHGLEKYNTAFRSDLTANIATYTPEQRAVHVHRLSQLS